MKKKFLASVLSLVLAIQTVPVWAQQPLENLQNETVGLTEQDINIVPQEDTFPDEGGGESQGEPVEDSLRYMVIDRRATRYDSATVGISSLLETAGSGNYRVSAEYRLNQPEQQEVQLTFTVILNGNAEPVYLTLPPEARTPVNGGGWTELCGEFEIDPAGVTGAELKLVDDFELLEGEYQAAVQVRNVRIEKDGQELLYNGDFHAGLDGWRANGCQLSLYDADDTLIAQSEEGYTVPYELTEVQEPERYMRIDSREGSNASIEQNIAEQLMINGVGKYRISVTYKAPSEEAEQPVSFVVGVRGSEDGDEASWYTLGDTPPKPSLQEWVTVSADLDISWNGEPVYAIFKPVDGTAAESIWIGNLSMVCLETGAQVLKNYDFENGANSYDLGWTASGCTPVMVDHKNVSEEMLSGYNAFLVRREHEYASPTQYITDGLKEQGEGLYTVTAWYRSDNPERALRGRYTLALTIDTEGEDLIKYYTAHPVMADNSGFVRLTSTFYLDWSEGTLRSAYLKILDNVEGEIVDAMVTGLSVTGPDGSELLQNADFSKGINNWSIDACVCYIMYTDGTVSSKYYTGMQEDSSGDYIPSYSPGSGSGTANDRSKRYILVEDRANQYVSPEQDITEALNAAGPGKFTIRGWYKSFTGAERVHPTIGIRRKGSKGYQYYSVGKSMLTSKRGWGELKEEIDLYWEGELESAFIKLIDGTGNKNSIYVDEFSMTPYQEDTNLLINGDFEQGAYGWKDNGCSMTVIGEPLPAEYIDLQPGENCMLIKDRQDQYASGVQDITQALLSHGKGKYEASVTLRTEYGAQKPTFTLVVKGSGDKDNRYYNINVNRPAAIYNKWVVCEGIFDIDWSGDLEYAQFKLIDGFTGTDSMYIKNASLKKDGQELLNNPNFQEGTKGWTGENCSLQAIGSIKVDQEVNSREGFSGENYLMIRDKADGYASITQDITKPLRENGQGKYRISGWYKAVDQPEFVTFTVGLLDDTDQWVYYTMEDQAVYVDGEKWVCLSAEFDLAWQGMLQDAMFKVLDGYRSTSSMYVDDFQFVCESTGEQILRNPDFEGGDAGWIEDRVTCALMDSQGIAQPKTRTEANGSYLKVYGRDSKYSAPEQVITSALEENGQGFYEISAWFKRIDGETPVSLTVSVLDETEEWKYFVVPQEQQVVLKDDGVWYQVKALVDVYWTGELEEAFFKLIDGTNGGESMYVDDVSMIRQDTGVQLLRNTDFEQGKLYYRRNEGFSMEPVFQ